MHHSWVTSKGQEADFIEFKCVWIRCVHNSLWIMSKISGSSSVESVQCKIIKSFGVLKLPFLIWNAWHYDMQCPLSVWYFYATPKFGSGLSNFCFLLQSFVVSRISLSRDCLFVVRWVYLFWGLLIVFGLHRF